MNNILAITKNLSEIARNNVTEKYCDQEISKRLENKF